MIGPIPCGRAAGSGRVRRIHDGVLNERRTSGQHRAGRLLATDPATEREHAGGRHRRACHPEPEQPRVPDGHRSGRFSAHGDIAGNRKAHIYLGRSLGVHLLLGDQPRDHEYGHLAGSLRIRPTRRPRLHRRQAHRPRRSDFGRRRQLPSAQPLQEAGGRPPLRRTRRRDPPRVRTPHGQVGRGGEPAAQVGTDSRPGNGRCSPEHLRDEGGGCGGGRDGVDARSWRAQRRLLADRLLRREVRWCDLRCDRAQDRSGRLGDDRSGGKIPGLPLRLHPHLAFRTGAGRAEGGPARDARRPEAQPWV